MFQADTDVAAKHWPIALPNLCHSPPQQAAGTYVTKCMNRVHAPAVVAPQASAQPWGYPHGEIALCCHALHQSKLQQTTDCHPRITTRRHCHNHCKQLLPIRQLACTKTSNVAGTYCSMPVPWQAACLRAKLCSFGKRVSTWRNQLWNHCHKESTHHPSLFNPYLQTSPCTAHPALIAPAAPSTQHMSQQAANNITHNAGRKTR